jgi:hypothetical protein
MVIQQRQDIEGVKQDAETKRKLMDVTAKAHDSEMREQNKARDTDIDNDTKIQIEQLKAQVAILLANMDHRQAHLASQETTERAI